MQITLNEEERLLLAEMLDAELRELRSQIYHAETHNVKEQLKHREAVVRVLLERLGVSISEVAP